MVTFQNKPYSKQGSFDAMTRQAKKRPFMVFGLPFLAIMVAGSFGLSQLTQTRYDNRDRKTTKLAKEDALGMDKNRRKLSLQEEYFRLQAQTDEDWDNVRIERPSGTKE